MLLILGWQYGAEGVWVNTGKSFSITPTSETNPTKLNMTVSTESRAAALAQPDIFGTYIYQGVYSAGRPIYNKEIGSKQHYLMIRPRKTAWGIYNNLGQAIAKAGRGTNSPDIPETAESTRLLQNSWEYLDPTNSWVKDETFTVS